MSPQVNGTSPHGAQNSVFIQHLLNYPVISDSVDTFKSNEYGQRSIKLGDSAYQTFAAPVLPWLAKPYEFVSPYVSRADTFGDKTLKSLDERFPVVKKPTGELYNDTKGLIFLPYTKGLEGRDHVFDVYNSEVKKNEGGYIGYGKAAVSTALVVSTETLNWISSFVNAKKAEASQTVHEKVNSH
jgi:hypothetical protein